MTDKIIDASYNNGRANFAVGGTLRALFARLDAAETGTPDDEAKAMSFALGFADALIDQLRAPMVVAK